MIDAARLDESRLISLIFQDALNAFGVDVVADALELWQDVQPTPSQAAASSGRWLAKVDNLVALRRADARALAFSYYRYFRALHTGFTYPPLEGEVGKTVPLKELREEFYDLVNDMAPDVLTSSRPTADAAIKVEKADEDLAKTFDQLDADVNDYAREELDSKGYAVMLKKMADIDNSKPATEVDVKREAAHAEAGARQAAAAMRMVRVGGVDVIDKTAIQDKRALGYVRVSSTGTPCGFCAMLISRGIDNLYTSEANAEFATAKANKRAEGEQYHDNCQCVSEAVYSEEQYNSNPKFDLNREMDAAWPKVTDGLKGKEALTVWRRYIRARNTQLDERSRRAEQAA